MRHLTMGWVVLTCAAAASAGPALHAEPADGRDPAARPVRIIRVVDDFAAYFDKARRAGTDERLALWISMLEAPHRLFFDQVLYRMKTGPERERYRGVLIDDFWREVAPDMPQIARAAADMNERVMGTLADFRRVLPDFVPGTDFYITISCKSFNGKVAEIDRKPVMAIGVENFQQPGVELQTTIAHELFHLYHFQHFSTAGATYRMLWAEGLATYASALVVPGHRRSLYLGFDAGRMNRLDELTPRMSGQLLELLRERDEKWLRVYFGAESNDTGIPPAAGYYVGLLICERIGRGMNLAEMARLPAPKVLALVDAELRAMAAGK